MDRLESRQTFSRMGLTLLAGILAGCNGGLSSHGPVDRGLEAFISPDAMVLAGINLEQLRATPLYRKLAARNRLPRFDQFRSESGFDPSRDIRQVLLTSDGQNVLAIARGSFPGKPSGDFTAGEYRGYTMYSRNSNETIAYVGKDTALGGQPGAVRTAIDQYKSGGGAPRNLMERVRGLPAGVQVWAVVAGWRGLAPEQLRAMGNLGNFDRVLRLAANASLSVDLRNGIHAVFSSESRTEPEAKTLGDSLRGLATLAQVDKFDVKQNGTAVEANIQIPEDLAEKWVK